MPQEARVAVKVWDLPVRLFHWILVLLLVFQYASGKIGGGLMAWHVYSGYGVLVLVVFRILWGFAGSTHARFASFLKGPAAALHLRTTKDPDDEFLPLSSGMLKMPQGVFCKRDPDVLP